MYYYYTRNTIIRKHTRGLKSMSRKKFGNVLACYLPKVLLYDKCFEANFDAILEVNMHW